MSGVVASCRIPPARSGLRRVAGPTQAVGDDDLVSAAPLLYKVGDWRTLLSLPADEDEADALRRHQRTGRPLGDDSFFDRLEADLGRPLRPRKPGPKPRKTPREPRDQKHVSGIRSCEISNISPEPKICPRTPVPGTSGCSQIEALRRQQIAVKAYLYAAPIMLLTRRMARIV